MQVQLEPDFRCAFVISKLPYFANACLQTRDKQELHLAKNRIPCKLAYADWALAVDASSAGVVPAHAWRQNVALEDEGCALIHAIQRTSVLTKKTK